MFLILISIKNFNQSLFYLDKKLIIVDESCRTFTNGTLLSRFADLRKKFSSAISSQYLALARAEVLRSIFSADIILVILGEFMVLYIEDTSRVSECVRTSTNTYGTVPFFLLHYGILLIILMLYLHISNSY